MAKKSERTRRDAAGVGPDPDGRRRHLVSLDHLDGYTVAHGEPDIRGWDVRTLGGRELGEVEDLLVDPEHGEVVMLEVELRDGGVHAEVPIRSVQLDRRQQVVIVDSGDVDPRNDVRARDRIDDNERERLQDSYGDRTGTVRYGERKEHASSSGDEEADEVVLERRPVVEEVVVRRKVVDEE